MPTYTSTVTRSRATARKREEPPPQFHAIQRDLLSPVSTGVPFREMFKDHSLKSPSNASNQERVEVFMDHSPPVSHGRLAREELNKAGFERVDKTSKAHHLKQARSMPLLRSGRHHDPRYKQAPMPLALRDEFRHQIPPITSLPVRQMNFQDRIYRRHIQDQSFLHSDSEEEEPKKPKDPERRRARGETAVERMKRDKLSEEEILARLGYGDDQDEPSVHEDAVKYIIKDYKPEP